MKRHLYRRKRVHAKHACLAAAAVAGSILSACGGSGESGETARNEPPQSLDTGQVLVLAKVTSENTTPFQVDDGALVLNDTSESTEPVSINAM